MGIRFRHLRDDERGTSLVFIGAGFLAFFAATTLAIDVGMFMTARSQAQNAADAGALSGAIALVRDSYTNRSASGPVVQSAINTGKANIVMEELVDIQPSDVTFPLDPSGEANRVRVDVFRTLSRNNPLATLIGSLLGVPTASVRATATAEASLANAMSCVRPFTIPDRWVEVGNPPWSPSDTYDRYYTSGPNTGQLRPNPDYYPTAEDPDYVGYNMETDKGLLLTIRAGTGDNIEPTMYYSWNMPGGTGGDWYRDNIAHCNQTLVHWDEVLVQEPGDMVGPTNQGIDELIAQDPTAYWDTATNTVVSTMNPSPRVFPLPLFDPEYYQSGKVTGRNTTLKVANWIGFFLVGRQGNNVEGRITPIMGVFDGNAGPAPPGTFPRYIRLVE
jgi:Flp pilus assembly protein TadG